MNRPGRIASAILVSITLVSCKDDPLRPDGGEVREYGVVVNSVSASVTIFPLAAPDSTRTVALGPGSTATTLAIRDGIALVPLGLIPAVAVIDLAAGVVIDEIPLPAGSGATGVAIVNDSLAFVANPGLNSVTPVYYRRGETGAEIDVGVYPTALIALGNRVFVVEANLVSFTPAGPSTMSVIDVASLEVHDDFPLTGYNAAAATTNGSDLFVINAGHFDSANASLSVVDPIAAAETAEHEGFGAFASEVVVLLDGTVLAVSPVYGLAHFDPDGPHFLIDPGLGFGSGGAANLLGIGLDSSQRVWVLDAEDCANPGRAVLLSGTGPVVVDEAEVEVCPDAIAFDVF